MAAWKPLAAVAVALIIASAGHVGGASSQETPGAAPPTLRFAVVASGNQNEVTYAIREAGLDRKHGINIEVIDVAAPGQQYTMVRSGAADIAGGSFVELLRQRKAGNAIQSIHGAQGYGNRFVVRPGSPVRTFADLKGRKVGTYGTTFIDWLIVRAAGKKAYNVDLETDATLVPGSPPLQNQLLAKGEVEAALQFMTLTLAPIARNEQRLMIDVPGLMTAAGFSPDIFNLQWTLTEKWARAHPGAVRRVQAMLSEAYAVLRTNDSLWPVLAQRLNVTDPAIIAAYRDLARRTNDPPYGGALIKPTQDVLDAIIAIAGEQAVGVATVDPAAFLFP